MNNGDDKNGINLHTRHTFRDYHQFLISECSIYQSSLYASVSVCRHKPFYSLNFMQSNGLLFNIKNRGKTHRKFAFCFIQAVKSNITTLASIMMQRQSLYTKQAKRTKENVKKYNKGNKNNVI